MWQKVGVSIFIGIVLLLIISLPIQGTISLLSRNIRAIIAPLTDRRVQLMNELIAGIQVLLENILFAILFLNNYIYLHG